MIKIHIFPVTFICLLIHGCSTLEQNKKARKDLEKSFPIPYDKIKEEIDKKVAEALKKNDGKDLIQKSSDIKKGIKGKLK